MSFVVPIPERGRAKWESFQLALAGVDSVPCAGRDEWISEYAEDRSYAAGHCRGCPIFAQCGDAATAIGMRVGVWGGKDRTPPKQSKPIPLFDLTEEIA